MTTVLPSINGWLDCRRGPGRVLRLSILTVVIKVNLQSSGTRTRHFDADFKNVINFATLVAITAD